MAIFDDTTRFSFLEYQALMLVLAGGIALGLLTVEFAMKRFQVLAVLFPGMFSIRERKLFFFDFEVKDGALANRLRSQSKALVCMTLCVVMSYLWQKCVLHTTQQVGRKFPSDMCALNMDCFASPLDVTTLLTRSYEPVDCSGPKLPFGRQKVVSCVQFVKPSATDWLMQIAIAQSVTQLNIKCFEVFVQLSGNYRWVRNFVGFSFFISLVLLLILFFTGVMAKFVSSWLSFVMTLSVPTFLLIVWRTSSCFQELWQAQAEELQHSIEEHLKVALADLPGGGVVQEVSMAGSVVGSMPSKAAQMAKSILKISGFALKGTPSLARMRSGPKSEEQFGNGSSLLPPLAPPQMPPDRPDEASAMTA